MYFDDNNTGDRRPGKYGGMDRYDQANSRYFSFAAGPSKPILCSEC